MSQYQVVKVMDTREWVREGNKWMSLPGTGEARLCDRCGKSHEIHWTLHNRMDNSFMVVGGSCAMIIAGLTKNDVRSMEEGATEKVKNIYRRGMKK